MVTNVKYLIIIVHFFQMDMNLNVRIVNELAGGVERMIPSSSNASDRAVDSSDSLDGFDNSMPVDSTSQSEKESEDDENVQIFAAYAELLYGAIDLLYSKHQSECMGVGRKRRQTVIPCTPNG